MQSAVPEVPGSHALGAEGLHPPMEVSRETTLSSLVLAGRGASEVLDCLRRTQLSEQTPSTPVHGATDHRISFFFFFFLFFLNDFIYLFDRE